MSEEDEMVIFIHVGFWDAMARALVINLSLLVSVGLGWFLGSNALQWIGGIMWLLFFFATISRERKQSRMTAKAAREKLDELLRQ